MLLARPVLVLSLLGLHLHAGDSAKLLFDAVRNDDLAALKRALTQGADANARGDRNMTLLMAAAAYGSPEAMRLLLEANADVKAKNDFDATALMWGIGEMEKVRLLLDNGADVTAVSQKQSSALLLACERDGTEATVRLLLARGADLKVKDKPGNSVLAGASLVHNVAVARLLLDKGLDVNVRDGFGFTPLMNAAENGNLELTKMLLAKGADVNAVTAKPFKEVKNGTIQLGEFTPLLLAATHGPRDLVETLLSAGARVNVKDSRGMTPLHYAVSGESLDPAIIKLLLDAGADPAIKTGSGETAADWAAKFGDPAILKLLPGARAARPRIIPVSAPSKPDPRGAAQKSLNLMQAVSGPFFEKGGCISCHAQNITRSPSILLAVTVCRWMSAAQKRNGRWQGWAGTHKETLSLCGTIRRAESIPSCTLCRNLPRPATPRMSPPMPYSTIWPRVRHRMAHGISPTSCGSRWKTVISPERQWP